MSSTPSAIGDINHPYGLPMGTVRGFMSILICSFFWIVLLLPEPQAVKAPLGHFFLLTLVFLAFASHPGRNSDESTPYWPWIMRVIFVGGSALVVAYVAYKFPDRLDDRLTPSESIKQWPVLLWTLAGGFGTGLFLRFVLGRENHLFQTVRAWFGVVAMILLIAETVIQFLILPTRPVKPADETLKIWEAVLIAVTAGYFGMRA